MNPTSPLSFAAALAMFAAAPADTPRKAQPEPKVKVAYAVGCKDGTPVLVHVVTTGPVDVVLPLQADKCPRHSVGLDRVAGAN